MSIDAIIEQQLASMDLKQLEDLFESADQNGSLFGSVKPGDLILSMLKGEPVVDVNSIVHAISRHFMQEFYSSILLGIQLVIICVIIGLLKNMADSFSEDTVANLGVIVCSCCVMVLCMKSVMDLYLLCSNAVATMTVTMQVLLPVLVPLLIAMGGFTSGGVLNPLIVTSITVFNSLLQKFILPGIYISCILLLINSLSEKSYVGKLALFLRGAAISVMGLMVTLFSGITMVQGLVTKTADGMLAKTAKYSVDNFVPIVGGFAADSLDLIMSCTAVIKNGIGIFGLFIILALLILPMIKIAAAALVFKISAVLIEPIGNKTISDCLNEVGNTVITLAIILALAAMMFIIFLSVIIGIGGGSLLK